MGGTIEAQLLRTEVAYIRRSYPVCNVTAQPAPKQKPVCHSAAAHKAKKLVSADSLRKVDSRRRLGCTMFGKEAGTCTGCCAHGWKQQNDSEGSCWAGKGRRHMRRVLRNAGKGQHSGCELQLSAQLRHTQLLTHPCAHLRWRGSARGAHAAVCQPPVAVARLRPATQMNQAK